MKKFLAVLSMIFMLGGQSSIALGQTRIFRGSQGQLTDVEGVQAEGSGSLPKPILIGGDNGTDITNILVDVAGHLQVDVLTTALPTGAATAANQVLEIALLTTIDADTSLISLEATQLSVLDILETDILDALTGHEGDFQAVFPTPLAFNVDSIAGATAGGIASLVLRDDVLTTLTPVDGDYVRLRVNSTGQLHVTSSAAALASEYAEDSIAANMDIGQFVLGVSNEALGISVADGDYVAFATDQTGRTLGIPMTSTSFSFAQQLGKPEDTLHVTGDSGVPIWGVRNDGAGTVFTAVNLEYTPMAMDGNGVVFMQGRRAEDSISAGGHFLLPISAIRDDALSAGGGVGADGDYNFVRVDNEGALWIQGATLEDSIAGDGDGGLAAWGIANTSIAAKAANGDYLGIALSTTGVVLSTPVYDAAILATNRAVKRENDAFAGGEALIGIGVVRDDVLATLTPIDGDYTVLRVDSTGRLHVGGTLLDSIATSASNLSGTVSGAEQQVDVVTSALPTGASTSALQTTGNAILTTIDADTSALFGTVSGSEQQVDIVAALPAGTNNIGDVDVLTVPVSGTSFFSEKETAIAAASINFSFGFTSKKIIIETDSANGDEVCIDWLGGTAVCPAANTAGDDRVGAGRAITLDDMAVTSISIISSSGTNTVTVRAWN